MFQIRYTRDQTTILGVQSCMSEDGLESLASNVTAIDMCDAQKPVSATLHFGSEEEMKVEITEMMVRKLKK